MVTSLTFVLKMSQVTLGSLFLLSIFIYTHGYDRTCPHSSQWNITSRYYECSGQNMYICLMDGIKSNGSNTIYTETCGSEDVSREGFKYILTPNLYQVQCAASQYQPFTFTTNGNSQCVLSKSLCKESGQILAKNGSSSIDKSCRCDYRRNYDYVIPPNDPCSCKPAEEDCSCYIRKCEDDKVMIADYRCLKKTATILPEDIKCPLISRIVTSEEADISYSAEDWVLVLSNSRTWSKQASVILIVVVIIYTVLNGFLFIGVPRVNRIMLESKPGLSVKRKDNEFMVLNDDNVTIKCNIKSYFPVCSVTWKKERKSDSMIITSVAEKIEIICGKTPCLKINHFNGNDEGKYKCIVRNAIFLRNDMFGSCMKSLSSIGCLQRFVDVLQHIPAFHIKDITIHTYDIESQSKPTVYNIYKGDDVTMKQCFSAQQKLQTVKWLKGINKMTEVDTSNEQYSGGVVDVPTLTIKKTTLEDAGEYSCILRYCNGETKMSSFKLKVIPQVKIYKALLEHRGDTTFIRPGICNTIDKQMQENNIVVITGREGTGKSKICLELASFYDEKDYMVLKVNLSEQYTMYTYIVDTLLIIDDQQYTQDSLNAFMKHISPVLTNRTIKMILTCRDLDLDIVKNVPEINSLKGEAFIDINSCLTPEEKEKLLRGYMAVNKIASDKSNYRNSIILKDLSLKVALDEDAINIIKNEEPWTGFPLCVSLFCSDRKCFYLGEKYFTNPPKYLLNEIKELYISATKQSHCIDKINDYCVLAYIMEHHQLNLKDRNFCSRLTELYKTHFDYEYRPRNPGSIRDQEIATEEVLKRMNNKYLKFHEGIYEFIHPCLLKAMFLSSDSMVSYLLQNGSLHDITEFVRCKDYTGLADELFIKLDKNYYDILCSRLLKHAFEDHSLLQHVAQYIYSYWRSSGSELLNKIFCNIESMLQNSLCLHINNLQPLKNGSFFSLNEKDQMNITFSQIIMLVEELSYKGKDPWIYGADTADFIILSGLVTAAIGRYITYKKSTFTILLSEFQKRIHSKSFVKLFSKPLDKNGNTLFHYVMCFSHTEACEVLSVNEIRQNIFGTENIEKYTPLDIAAYLGKITVLEVLNLNICTKESRERLLTLAKNGKVIFCSETYKNKNSYQAMVDVLKDKGVSPEQPKREDADEEKDEIKNESYKRKNILCIDGCMISVVDFGGEKDYQSCIKLLCE